MWGFFNLEKKTQTFVVSSHDNGFRIAPSYNTWRGSYILDMVCQPLFFLNYHWNMFSFMY